MYVPPAAALAVQHRRPGVAIGLKCRPGRLLERVQDRSDLRVARAVVRSPGDHPRRVLVLERQRVGDGRYLVRIPAEDVDALARLSGRVPLADS